LASRKDGELKAKKAACTVKGGDGLAFGSIVVMLIKKAESGNKALAVPMVKRQSRLPKL